MSFLNRGNLFKGFAVLLIVVFVLELFVVFMFNPQTNPNSGANGSPGALSSIAQGEYVSSSLDPFVVNRFTGTVFFTCVVDATAFPDLPNVLGKAVKVGNVQNSSLFLARFVNNSVNESIVGEFSRSVSSLCSGGNANRPFALYREATVMFNASSVQLVSLSNNSKTLNLSKQLFDSYVDSLGRGAVGLIYENSVVAGNVVDLRMRLVMDSSGKIVPDSVILEQPALPIQTRQLNVDGTILSFTGRQIAVVEVPWENRFVKPVGFQNVSQEAFEPVDQIVVLNSSLNSSVLNASFVESVEQFGNDVVITTVANFSDKNAVQEAFKSFNVSLQFPATRFIVDFNSADVPDLNYSEFFKEAIVIPAARVDANDSLELPANFSALVYRNASIGQTLPFLVRASVDQGEIVKVDVRQK